MATGRYCRFHSRFPCYIVLALIFYGLSPLFKKHLLASGQDDIEAVHCKGNVNATRCHMECLPHCTCTLDNITIISNCTDGNITMITVLYPPTEVRNLSWANSSVDRIEPMTFSMFASSLKVLDLSLNELCELEVGLFDGLVKLERLFLHNNQIRKIQASVLVELQNLLELHLENNYNVIYSLQPGSFEGLTNLTELYLQNNAIYNLHPDVFGGLNNLEWLFLISNSLQVIQSSIFPKLSNLLVLTLSNNSIYEILSTAFDSLSSLQILLLSSNQLYYLPSALFKNQTKLVVLQLSHNYLHHLPANIFVHTDMKLLLLEDNVIQMLQPGPFEDLTNLKVLNLSNNALKELHPSIFAGLRNLEQLFLSSNLLQEIQRSIFQGLSHLAWLVLGNNSMYKISHSAFDSLSNLQILSLSSNRLNFLPSTLFKNQTKLMYIYLHHNQLNQLPVNIFTSLIHLRILNLENNNLYQIPVLSHCTSLGIVRVQNNPLLWINSNIFVGLNKTVTLLVTSAATCCYASSVTCHHEDDPSPFLTCKRLLPSDFLRIIMWFMSVICIFGNVCALYIGFRSRKQNNKVQKFLIVNLSISDIMMCIYLLILLSVDVYYAEFFPANSDLWRRSTLCQVAGALSVLSSEASAFFITLISIDRYLRIKYRYPFGRWYLRVTLARWLVVLLWTSAFSLSITTFVLGLEDSIRLYSVSEVCIGLPISKFNVYYPDTYASNATFHLYYNTSVVFQWKEPIVKATFQRNMVSMYLSIAMFTGINLVCFSVVGFCYTAIFIEVRKRKPSSTSRHSQIFNREMQMALNMSLLVLTDFACWVPIGVLSILVQSDAVEVSPIAYAWIATFVLPINSAINSFLYSFAGFSFDKLKCFQSHRRHARNQEENIEMKEMSKK